MINTIGHLPFNFQIIQAKPLLKYRILDIKTTSQFGLQPFSFFVAHFIESRIARSVAGSNEAIIRYRLEAERQMEKAFSIGRSVISMRTRRGPESDLCHLKHMGEDIFENPDNFHRS
jgi:hypothetical protein